jgi:glycosyltransferase involved in cell wall biosynthesis
MNLINMRVGIVMPLAVQLGGGERMLTDLLEYGRRASVAWTVIFLEDGPMVQQVKSWGIDTYVIQAGRLREIHRLISTITAIAKLGRQHKFDVIIGWMPKAHVYSGLAAKIINIPALWYDLEGPRKTGRLRQLINRIPAHAVITLSKASYDLQKHLFPHIQRCLVYPGVDLARFSSSVIGSKQLIRKKLGLPIDVPIVGIVGRMQRWKGIHTLVAAIEEVRQKHPNVHCVIVGGEFELEKDYFREVKQLAIDLNLQECTIFAGQQAEIPDWTQAMDIVVHASENEPFGIVVIEGMALGKPMVAGSKGGPAEIITPGVNGLLTHYDDIHGLSEAIIYYLDNPDIAIQMGQSAMKRAHDFSIQKYAENFINEISSLVSCNTSS